MNQTELAARITAWTWAAETLGQPAPPERIRGLIEVTRGVKAENLKPAIEAAMQADPNGFLPAPGAVIAQAKKIAERDWRERDQRKIDARINQARIEARTSPASPEEIQAIRDKIERLAKTRGRPGQTVKTVHGYRPSNAIKDTNDSKGIAAAKAAALGRNGGAA